MTAELVLRPEDPLDLDEARRLVAIIEGLPPGLRVHVDVSALREVHPTGLALLGHAFRREERVTFGGLDRRQERLLAYLLAESALRASGGGPPAPTPAATSTSNPAATAPPTTNPNAA